MFFRFVTKHASDRQTDEKNYDSYTVLACVAYASRGKKLSPGCHKTHKQTVDLYTVHLGQRVSLVGLFVQMNDRPCTAADQSSQCCGITQCGLS